MSSVQLYSSKEFLSMSIANSEIQGDLVAAGGDSQAVSRPKNRPRGKYKPRLSSSMLEAMKQAMKKSDQARRIMRSILVWTEAERSITQAEIDLLIEAAPITAVAAGLYRDRLARVGKLDHLIARLALVVGELDSGLKDATEKARGADLTPAPSRNGEA
jgi:hypothetical protein